MRMRSVCLLLLAGLVLAGCDSDCPTPTSPSSPGGPGLSVASLTISGPSELQVGSTAQLTATAHYSDGSQANVTNEVTWVTNNVNICTVSESGLLKAVAKGVCTVTAVIDNTTGTKTITIVDPNDPNGPPATPPSGSGGLVLEGPNHVDVGQQIQLRAFVVDGHREVTDQANWTGSNSGVATVGGEGRVTGRSNGYVTVTAIFEGKTGTKQIEVGSPDGPPPPVCGTTPCPPPPTCSNPPCPPSGTVTALAISGTTSVAVGGTSQLTAIATIDGASQNVTNSAQWTSGNAGIASVNGTGLVTGKAKGSTPITATYGGKTATVTFNVTDGGGPTNPTANSLTVTGTTPMTVGQTAQYNAVAHMSDGTNPNVNGQAQWTSSNTGVATVSSTGVVTAKAAGTTQIRATYQGKSGTVNLTVNDGGGPTEPDLIGLEAHIDGDVLAGDGPLGLDLDLSHLLNGNPILDLTVYGLYSDGSKKDVTNLATIDSPLLSIDGQGTAEVIGLLLQGLLNPDHPINITYGGYTANVVVHLQLPVLETLGFPTNQISVVNGNKLPSLQGLFSQGISSTIDSSIPDITYALTADGPLASLLGTLGIDLSGLLNVVNGVVQVDTGLLNTLLANPLIAPLLGPGGVLPLKLTATLDGVTTAPVDLLLGH